MPNTSQTDFREFFKTATDKPPYDWQTRLAEEPECKSRLIDIPTGLGKTAGVTLAWLWNRNKASSGEAPTTPWPRRLVYCLPMRTLVEQTESEVKNWLDALEEKKLLPNKRPRVVILMGGEDPGDKDWDLYPEQPAILIGTQDMLLSRALNRGYGMSRYRWPMHFALLNNDALWVMDEVQLMGAGLSSTTQLEGFRNPAEQAAQPRLGSHNCHSWWMSATIRPDWLKTVDLPPYLIESKPLHLTSQEQEDGGRVEALRNAPKSLNRSTVSSGNKTEKAIAAYIAENRCQDHLNLVVLNTVKRARLLHKALSTRIGKSAPRPILLHSQFRPLDRLRILEAIHSASPGQIIVSTQVIEAGIDLSAHTLFTELAPWSSLVQRFGRCNRHLVDAQPQFPDAAIHWFDLDCEKEALPYESAQLAAARQHLETLEDATIAALESVPSPDEDKPQFRHVLRRKDLIELFDTTPDLAGADLDIDRFIRDTDTSHVQVFWRDWEDKTPNGNEEQGLDPEARPRREELCSVAKHEFADFVKKLKSGNAWRWNALDRQWQIAKADTVYPGQIYLLHCDQGGYEESSKNSLALGWTGDPKNKPKSIIPRETLDSKPEDSTDDDSASILKQWQTLAEHTDCVCQTLQDILNTLSGDFCTLPLDGQASLTEILNTAARWHDWGKALPAFQAKLIADAVLSAAIDGPVAKAPEHAWRKGRLPDKPKPEDDRRKHYRHELASALGVLQSDSGFPLSGMACDLAAYLIAAHHGKVRLSIRCLPGEWIPPTNSSPSRSPRFACGVWDGDNLPATDLGEGIRANPLQLSLEPMELGLGEEAPFIDQPSWAERALTLRDTLGPFALAYLETLLRAADGRGSKAAQAASPLINQRH
ncbi:MAG: CRISPR-associated endonuclease Cas3'' [Opitutales bacterium]|nr:CRISPR-associated endonuclease Cas3'' [Opitutales bacterium]